MTRRGQHRGADLFFGLWGREEVSLSLLLVVIVLLLLLHGRCLCFVIYQFFRVNLQYLCYLEKHFETGLAAIAYIGIHYAETVKSPLNSYGMDKTIELILYFPRHTLSSHPKHQEQIHLSDGYKKYLYVSDKWSENVAMYNAMIVALIH